MLIIRLRYAQAEDGPLFRFRRKAELGANVGNGIYCKRRMAQGRLMGRAGEIPEHTDTAA